MFSSESFNKVCLLETLGPIDRTCISDEVFLEILSHLLENLLVKSVEMNYQCIGRMHLEANFLVQANFAFYTPAPALPAQNLQLLFLNLMPLHSRICVSSKRVRCWLQAMGNLSFWSFWELKPSIWGSRGWDSKYCWGPHIFIGYMWVYYWSKLISCLNGQEDGASDVTSLQSESQAHTPMKNISNTNFPTGSQDIFHGLPNVLLLHFCQLRVVRNCFAKQLSRCCLQIKVISRLKP